MTSETERSSRKTHTERPIDVRLFNEKVYQINVIYPLDICSVQLEATVGARVELTSGDSHHP